MLIGQGCDRCCPRETVSAQRQERLQTKKVIEALGKVRTLRSSAQREALAELMKFTVWRRTSGA